MPRPGLLPSLAVLVVLSAGVARGATCRDVTFPEQVRVDGRTLALNGLGVRKATLLKIGVYVAALYVAAPSHDAGTLLAPDQPWELVLHFVRSVSGQDVAAAWDEGFAKDPAIRAPGMRQRVDTLKGWMPDVASGERITFRHDPGTGVVVDVNGTTKGTVPGDDFARALLGIWLGPDPPNPEIRAGLLGGSCG
jgi:hypothetical protein